MGFWKQWESVRLEVRWTCRKTHVVASDCTGKPPKVVLWSFHPNTTGNVRLSQHPLLGKWTKQFFVDVGNVLHSIYLSHHFPVIANRETEVWGGREKRVIIMYLSSLSSAGSDMSIPVRALLAAHHLYIPELAFSEIQCNVKISCQPRIREGFIVLLHLKWVDRLSDAYSLSSDLKLKEEIHYGLHRACSKDCIVIAF